MYKNIQLACPAEQSGTRDGHIIQGWFGVNAGLVTVSGARGLVPVIGERSVESSIPGCSSRSRIQTQHK